MNYHAHFARIMSKICLVSFFLKKRANNIEWLSPVKKMRQTSNIEIENPNLIQKGSKRKNQKNNSIFRNKIVKRVKL